MAKLNNAIFVKFQLVKIVQKLLEATLETMLYLIGVFVDETLSFHCTILNIDTQSYAIALFSMSILILDLDVLEATLFSV